MSTTRTDSHPPRRAGTAAAPPPAADPQAAARVLRRFRQVFTAVRAHFQMVEKQVGIGGAQVWALGVVAEQPGIAVGALARALHIHQSTASNLVRGLTERGLVRSERGAADRRTVYLHLEPAGHALLARAPVPHAGVLSQALEELDAATLKRLEADLHQLLRTMGQSDNAPASPIG